VRNPRQDGNISQARRASRGGRRRPGGSLGVRTVGHVSSSHHLVELNSAIRRPLASV
jgi:hypothetical protein